MPTASLTPSTRGIPRKVLRIQIRIRHAGHGIHPTRGERRHHPAGIIHHEKDAFSEFQGFAECFRKGFKPGRPRVGPEHGRNHLHIVFPIPVKFPESIQANKFSIATDPFMAVLDCPGRQRLMVSLASPNHRHAQKQRCRTGCTRLLLPIACKSGGPQTHLMR
ncbi:MAG: hypothetical protein BWY82_00933 [Verrucomicrobia bacterium ADurb.Bin474]|nr:MAG: hypothetical protein BWY82_00933 [Verrucomicrobia bacterium ADurb.Bin474]